MKIAAVVVTYNRLNLLKECINAIRNQTHKVDEIIVVNNSSTDGTLEWLNQQNALTVITQENSGSAGGQYTGIKTAYEKGYDWIWCMDDDCLPDKSCLENQIPTNFNTVTGPLVLSKNTKKPIWNQDYNGLKYKILNALKVPFVTIPFNGFLISNNIVRNIGFPIKDLFIYCDDVEYSYRVKKYNYNLQICRNAILYHPDVRVNSNLNDKFYYYYIRNNILVSFKYDFLYMRTLSKIIKFILLFLMNKRIVILKAIKDSFNQ